MVLPWYDSEIQEFTEEIFWVLPKESRWKPTMPSATLDVLRMGIPTNGLPLADPTFSKPNLTYMLFGVGFFAKIVMSVIQRNIDGTTLIETTLGIVVFGEEGDETTGQPISCIQYKKEDQLDKLLERLWQQDQIRAGSKYSEEALAEKHFKETHRRDESGRFIVKIPIKEEIKELGSSREIALRRFFYLEKRLEKHPEIRKIYIEKMREEIQLGHLAEAKERPKQGEMVYYIPHHCIPKDNRIVYDASCKTDNGISLNDIQMLGPKMQKDLQETIMRFRRHRIAIYADIRKMFNQVKLAKEQWNLQRLFWREDSNQKLKEYWLTVVTFGLTASPFVAVRSVIETARLAKENYPKAAKAIEEDFYIDDCTTGAHTVKEAIKLAKEIDTILKGAKFELRKWKSNSNAVIQAMDSESEKTLLFSEGEGTTILGLKWLIEEDKFTFMVKNPKFDGIITKRKIVSHVAQLYDPNGYISPVTIIGKILIQDIWRSRIDWDDRPATEIERRWSEFWDSIRYLENFKIERWLGSGGSTSIQVHGFSDSSEAALGAVVYLRANYGNRVITSKLLTSKTRVAPLKMVTIPRLELSAAELLSKMIKEIMESMEWKGTEYVLWIDSSPAFYWIRKETRDLRTYVANRVASIQANTEIRNWRHIDGKENPADLLTRGMLPKELVGNNLWLHGPSWIIKEEQEWPKSGIMEGINKEMENEMKIHSISQFKEPISIGLGRGRGKVPLLEYVSKLEKAVNIVSYVNRYIDNWIESRRNLKPRRKRRKGPQEVMPPTREEKAGAMEYLIRISQQEYYNREITALKAGKALPEKSKIISLKPILDKNNILRVGGGVGRSEIDYEMKHPAIVANGSILAGLLMEYAHRSTEHGGIQVMMQFIRQQYWIPKLRNGLRNYIHKCVVCVRLNARMEGQLMAELPSERVQVGKPFLSTGVDYAGPFQLGKPGKLGRKNKGQGEKWWVAIFVCLRTRAIHIEPVTDLSSMAFIATYERFIARRGRCEKMFSDNGTAFVGASKELNKALRIFSDKDMLDHLHRKGTDWRFMTPAAPHQGGIYEAAVKSMKFHLRRIMGQRMLPPEEFRTLLTQIEAILNSRPLHPLSEDPMDIQALTPGHFLVGEPLILPLPFRLDDRSDSVRTALWKELQRMIQHFWVRWQSEYLTTLQERKKWRREKENIKVGQLVVLRSENFPLRVGLWLEYVNCCLARTV
ncbi:uncharacterized protein LOC129950394 [Eupeodes corollae]|uniref:uncharacterized protein LOC129950394 n=1 Tax=Eupeodes corollae TaxID=290404 RepID=UPI002493A16E|nr:uncharacterized protein LOC129950394 [Eupeodes corollae]